MFQLNITDIGILLWEKTFQRKKGQVESSSYFEVIRPSMPIIKKCYTFCVLWLKIGWKTVVVRIRWK